MTHTEGTASNPLPADTKKVAPKVLAATGAAGSVVLVLLALAQFLYDRADLIAFLPDFWEPIVMALLTAALTFGAGYNARHQFRTATRERDTYRH